MQFKTAKVTIFCVLFNHHPHPTPTPTIAHGDFRYKACPPVYSESHLAAAGLLSPLSVLFPVIKTRGTAPGELAQPQNNPPPANPSIFVTRSPTQSHTQPEWPDRVAEFRTATATVGKRIRWKCLQSIFQPARTLLAALHDKVNWSGQSVGQSPGRSLDRSVVGQSASLSTVRSDRVSLQLSTLLTSVATRRFHQSPADTDDTGDGRAEGPLVGTPRAPVPLKASSSVTPSQLARPAPRFKPGVLGSPSRQTLLQL